MSHVSLGIDLDDLRLPTKEGLRAARELGGDVVELGAAAGEVTPEGLSTSGRRHLQHLVGTLGLKLAALSAEVPHTRLTDPSTVEERVERTCRILTLAADMGVRVVTASAGALTHPETGEPAPLALEALRRIGDQADTCGVCYALRPAHDTAQPLVRLFDQLDCPALALGVDPAAMVMLGHNPLSVIERLPNAIVLAHARDGTVGSAGRAGHETRLGEGEVDLVGFWQALADAGYGGPHILRRLDSETPRADLEAARDLIRRALSRGG
ncbi:MAG TPA: sugar phosphate isomerase/epimerase [Phycisphaerae bacterium]|nr:sugar phosphate isomerase/epimerase [Phycisphaerae bacterium]HNU44706.1 sugar phosphate isomerase/epimerase [Phycisphaerae bacterium]